MPRPTEHEDRGRCRDDDLDRTHDRVHHQTHSAALPLRGSGGCCRTEYEGAGVVATRAGSHSAGCHRIPVLDADGHLRGVVALDDLLTIFARHTDKLAEVAASEIAHAG